MAKNTIKTTKQLLDEAPKVKVKLPLDPLNPDVKTTVVAINGLSYGIERGVEVEVPQPVYEVLVNTGKY